jgi:hypothetical protein
MTKISTSKVGAVLVLLLMAVAGACGGGSPNTGIASLAGSHTTTTVKKSKAAAKQEMQDAALAFARCMRQHGVDMPDPTFDDNGGGMMIKQGGPAGGTGARPDDATMQAAQTACQPILDKAQQDMPRPSPAEEAKMRDQALKFAKCMRAHGVDMPDPTFDDNGGMKIEMHASGGANTNGPVNGSSGNGAAPKPPGDDPKVDAAMKACGGPGAGFSSSKAGK